MLLVDFLPPGAQPGVLGRRPNGEADDLDDDALLAYWVQLVEAVPEERRTGRWHVAYCLADRGSVIDTLALDYEVRFFLPPSTVRIAGWPLSSIQGRASLSAKPLARRLKQSCSSTTRGRVRLLLEWLRALVAQARLRKQHREERQ